MRLALDDVSLVGDTEQDPPTGGPEQLENGDFRAGSAGWFTYGTGAPQTGDGRLCATVPGGLTNPWDAGIGQNDVPLIAGSGTNDTRHASELTARASDHGIDAVLFDGEASIGEGSFFLIPVRVMVHEGDLAEARSLLPE